MDPRNIITIALGINAVIVAIAVIVARGRPRHAPVMYVALALLVIGALAAVMSR